MATVTVGLNCKYLVTAVVSLSVGLLTEYGEQTNMLCYVMGVSGRPVLQSYTNTMTLRRHQWLAAWLWMVYLKTE